MGAQQFVADGGENNSSNDRQMKIGIGQPANGAWIGRLRYVTGAALRPILKRPRF
jgi:hypothetical protein